VMCALLRSVLSMNECAKLAAVHTQLEFDVRQFPEVSKHFSSTSKYAPDRSAPPRLAGDIDAPRKNDPGNEAAFKNPCVMVAPLNTAGLASAAVTEPRSALVRLALMNVAPDRCAPFRFADDRFAVVIMAA